MQNTTPLGDQVTEFHGAPVYLSFHRAPEDDLASAGLGRDGLSSPLPPRFEDPLKPTPTELRRRAVYENYRALADVSRGGGFGRFFGPGVEGGELEQLISGREFRTCGIDNCTHILQLPDNFQADRPRLLVVPASSSRGVYGGIVIAEWGLQRGYAVVLTDKGTGTGFHDLSTDEVTNLEGAVMSAESDSQATFRVSDNRADLAAFTGRHPYRVALKHAHSGFNLEAKWGKYVLEATRFALHVLHDLHGLTADDVTVIASGLSNGGAASLRAAEEDVEGVIDGVAVAEPNITPAYDAKFVLEYGDRRFLEEHSKPLLHYASLLNLFQPVACHTSDYDGAPFCKPDGYRLRSFQSQGLWRGLSEQAAGFEAQMRLRNAGILPDQDVLAPSHLEWGLFEGMALNTASCHGGFTVSEHLLGLSYAAVRAEDMTPRPLNSQEKAALYATSNGIVPTATLRVINDRSFGGPVQSPHSISSSTGLPDQNFDGALKLAALALGATPINGDSLVGTLKSHHERIAKGTHSVLASGKLGSRPSLIVNGRCDSIISPNHASRSYLGKNFCEEGENSRLRYHEVEHAQHLDALNALPCFSHRFVPLLPYLFRALNEVEACLQADQDLSPNQVIRSHVRPSAEPLQAENIPYASASPDLKEQITWSDGVLRIPD